jgi:ABC-type lipopolysaccharide export system ATPase subunit
MRLYDPTEGRITIDGVDFRQFALEDLRRNVGALFQDFGRYDFTARENIRLGDVTYRGDGSRIVDAARQAGALGEIESLPHGWETVLGTSLGDGRDLSPFEWQRLALARALFRDAPILVLDEPSASLDPLAERDLFDRFHSLAASTPGCGRESDTDRDARPLITLPHDGGANFAKAGEVAWEGQGERGQMLGDVPGYRQQAGRAAAIGHVELKSVANDRHARLPLGKPGQ